MPRKPRKRYYQARGRPHVGLDNPEAFGLTFDEVVHLVNTNKWRAWYQKWRRKNKQRQRLLELDHTCPKCHKQYFLMQEWAGELCKQCFSDQQGEHAKKGEMYSKFIKCRNCSKAATTKSGFCEDCRSVFVAMLKLPKGSTE